MVRYPSILGVRPFAVWVRQPRISDLQILKKYMTSRRLFVRGQVARLDLTRYLRVWIHGLTAPIWSHLVAFMRLHVYLK